MATAEELARYTRRQEKLRATSRERFARRKLEGICVECDEPASEGKRRCAEHLDRDAEWHRLYSTWRFDP